MLIDDWKSWSNLVVHRFFSSFHHSRCKNYKIVTWSKFTQSELEDWWKSATHEMEIILQLRSNGRWLSCKCRNFFKPPPSPCMNSTQCLAPCFTSTKDHPFLSSSISSTSVDQTASEAPSPPVSRRKRSVSFSSSSSSSSPSRCVIQAVCRRCRRLYGFGALNTFAMIKTILGWFYILCDNGFALFWEPNIRPI